MATLTNQTIADSYEQLLSLPSGGLSGTTLRAITDGDSDTACVLEISTTKALIKGSGNKLFFSDEGGEYISGDNTDLTIGSGRYINLTATTDVYIPVNVGLRFGDGNQLIETDNTDLTIESDVAINLKAPVIDTVAQATTFELKQQVDALSFDGAADNILNIDAANNRVGIGTSTPSGTLHIVQTGAFSREDDATTNNLVLSRTQSAGDDVVGGSIAFTELNSEDEIRAQIALIQTTSDKDQCGLGFYVHESSADSDPCVEAMRIEYDGNVGIGTAAPAEPLHVISGSGDQLRLGYSASLYWDVRVGSGSDLLFRDNADATRVTFEDGGNVGIGVTDPDAALEILKTSTQLKLSYDATDFCTFTVDTNHDITITPSSTGQIKLKPTTDSVDFFQVLDADAGTPIFNVDSTNERVGIGTAAPDYPLEVTSTALRTVNITNTSTTGSVINYGLLVESNGSSSSTNIGLLCKASNAGAGSGYGLIVSEGNVGIHNTAPPKHLTIGANVSGDNVGLRLSSNTDAVSQILWSVNQTDKWSISNSAADLFYLYDYTTDAIEMSIVAATGVISGDFDDTSDINLKKDIADTTYGLSTLNQLRAVTFNWKNDNKGKGVGFIAQEVELIIPEIVHGNDYVAPINDTDTENLGKSINVTGIVSVLVKAMQELSAKVTALENA